MDRLIDCQDDQLYEAGFLCVLNPLSIYGDVGTEEAVILRNSRNL